MAINERLIDTAVAAGGDGFTEEVDGLILHLDANDVDSYDGDGDEWVDISTFNINPNTLTEAPPALSSPTPLISYATNDANSYIGTTTWKNLSSATYNASLGGATFSEADGSSLYFDDSTNDSVTTTYSSTGKSAVTWEGWFKIDQVGNNECIGSFSVNGGNVAIFAQSTSTNTPQGTSDYVYVKHADLVGTWIHIAVKFTGWAGSYSTSAYGAGISAQVYINGSSTGTVTVTPYGQSSSHNTIFRVMGNVTTYRAKGLLSEFRFYESGLSDADILANYNHGRVKFNELETADLELHLDAASFDGSTNTPTTWTALTGSNGTISGATFDSELGNWLDFSSANDKVTTTVGHTELPVTSAWSCDAWINFKQFGTNTNPFGMIDGAPGYLGWALYVTAAGLARPMINGNQQSPNKQLALDTWYHIAFSSTGSSLSYFVDGLLIGSTSTTISAPSTDFKLGHLDVYPQFIGKIGQVRLYDSALTSNQVKSNYLSTANLYPNGNDGALGTGTTKPTWNAAGYFDFDGSDYVQIADSSNENFAFNNQIFTQEYWVNIDDVSASENAISAKRDSNSGSGLRSWILSVISTGSIRFLYYNSSLGSQTIATSNNVVSSNTWHHIIVNGDGTNCKIYVDGELVQTTAFSLSDINESGSDLDIGRRGKNANSYVYFNGKIGQVRAYNAVLTELEIEARFDATKSHYGL